MDRGIIREKTMQLVYQMDVTGDFDYEHLNPVEEDASVLGKQQAITVLSAIRDHLTEIDETIAADLENWSFDRVSRTDLAILRTAVAEMLYVDSIPVNVSISEAVALSKRYGDDKSYAFVNSVLGKISRNIGAGA